MKSSASDATTLQREYYARTASEYEGLHVRDDDLHTFAAHLMLGAMESLGVRSVLDVGSGTGRIVSLLKRKRPETRVCGLEPVAELREVGYAHGIERGELVDGDAVHLPFNAGDFDLVCAFGVMHHLPKPRHAILEMLRVAKIAIFVSDGNNFGQGAPWARTAKHALHALGLWRLADLVKTRGRGYVLSEGDGLAYSYSVFTDYPIIRRRCSRVHILSLQGDGARAYRRAGHVALLGIR